MWWNWASALAPCCSASKLHTHAYTNAYTHKHQNHNHDNHAYIVFIYSTRVAWFFHMKIDWTIAVNGIMGCVNCGDYQPWFNHLISFDHDDNILKVRGQGQNPMPILPWPRHAYGNYVVQHLLVPCQRLLTYFPSILLVNIGYILKTNKAGSIWDSSWLKLWHKMTNYIGQGHWIYIGELRRHEDLLEQYYLKIAG